MPEENTTLGALELELRSLGPPSIGFLISYFEEYDSYIEFMALVREYLPESEHDILAEAEPGLQIGVFANRFADRYFPLWPYFGYGEAECYEELLRGIPFEVQGMGYDDYHEIAEGFRPGLQLMTYLIADPYCEDGGARLSIGVASRDHVPDALLERVPGRGLEPSDAHRLLDGTPYQGLARWADVLTCMTDNPFIDTTGEDIGYYELPPWDRETVDELARLWQEAEAIRSEYLGLAGMLEEDPTARFAGLLDFIERRRNEVSQQGA